MKQLAQDQPEFAEFLQKNEPSLLETAGDSEDEEEDEETTKEEETKAADKGRILLTTAKLKKLLKGAFSEKRGNWRGVIRVLQAFRAACHIDEDNDDVETKRGQEYKYKIPVTRSWAN